MNPEEFFNQLRDKAVSQFKSSPVYKKQKKDWGVSICDTTIKPGKLVLAGINWGGGNRDFGIQDHYPVDDISRSYKFLRGIDSLLQEHFNVQGVSNINYANVCFFRTPDESILEYDDWKNTIDLFQDYIEFIKPKGIIILGKTPIVMLKRFGKLTYEVQSYKGSLTVYAYSGLLFGKYKTFGVPHTNAHVLGPVRSDVWRDAADYVLNKEK